MRLIVGQAAKLEIRLAASWYDEQRSGLGDELLEEVERALARIVEFPHIGSLAPMVPEELGARRVLLSGFPLAVVYRVYRDQIRILALAHGQRKPGYWKDR